MSLTPSMLRPALRQSRHICRQIPATASFATSSSSAAATSSSSSKKQVLSSCLAGTRMNGLSILKDETDPLAKADDEYPKWLWSIIPTGKNADLASEESQASQPGGKFDFDAERKRLRAINKAKIKASNFIRGT